MRVAVVGGGHAGLLAALALAMAGHRVTLLEEHEKVGLPPHCTGVVSDNYLRFVEGLGVDRRAIGARRFDGVEVRAGGSPIARLRSAIYRVDRVALEAELLRLAIRAGVDARLGVKVLRVGADGSVAFRGGRERYDAIVVAEGWRARLLRDAGLPVSEPLRAYGVNYFVEAGRGGGGAGGYVEVETLDPRAPCFFSWRVPLGPELTLEGLASPREPVRPPRGARRPHGGIVLLGPPTPVKANRVVSFGDSSRLVKPLTGGGLAPQAEAVRIALSSGALEEDPVEALYRAQARVARRLAASYPLASALYRDCLLPRLAEALKGGGSDPIEVDFEFDSHVSAPNIARLLGSRLPATALIRAPRAALKLIAALAAGLASTVKA